MKDNSNTAKANALSSAFPDLVFSFCQRHARPISGQICGTSER